MIKLTFQEMIDLINISMNLGIFWVKEKIHLKRNLKRVAVLYIKCLKKIKQIMLYI